MDTPGASYIYGMYSIENGCLRWSEPVDAVTSGSGTADTEVRVMNGRLGQRDQAKLIREHQVERTLDIVHYHYKGGLAERKCPACECCFPAIGPAFRRWTSALGSYLTLHSAFWRKETTAHTTAAASRPRLQQSMS